MIFYPDSKECNYDVKETEDCVELDYKRINEGWGEDGNN